MLVAGKTCEKQSSCVLLKDCTPYMNLVRSVRKPLEPSIVNFLRSQECGFDKGYPKVCCSKFSEDLQGLKRGKHNSHNYVNNIRNDLARTDLPLIKSKKKIGTAFLNPGVNSDINADALKAFKSEYIDYTGFFDLMLRTKRHEDHDTLDIEIR